MINYVLVDAREDLGNTREPTAETRPAASQPKTAEGEPPPKRAPDAVLRAYVAPLVEFINSVPTDPEDMQQVHHRAALCVTWLADSELPEAAAGLEKIVGGRYSAIVRAAAAGLGKSRNRECCCRLSRPMLGSVYHDLMVDGALNLGRWGEKDAAKALGQAAASPTEMPVLKALACWYSLRIQGRGKSAAAELVKVAK